MAGGGRRGTGTLMSIADDSAGERQQPGVKRLATATVNVLAGPLSVSLLGLLLVLVPRGQRLAGDFSFAYWHAGRRVLAGVSPYIWTAAQFREGMAFVYPALSAVMFAPLSLIPRSIGAVLFTFVSIALLPLALWVLRVRDWRVYGIAALWEPFFVGWATANESLYLMFGLACVWRVRDRPWLTGLLAGALISLEPLLWPLGLWLVATRRWRASLHALAWGVALNLFAWGIVGFGQIGAYLHASATDTADAWRGGFGVPASLAHFGVAQTGGFAVMAVLCAGLAAGVLHAALVRHGEIPAFVLTVALALVSSPLLWSHYVMLVLVPLAILRPRLDWLWALPVVFWASQLPAPAQDWQIVLDWVIMAVILLPLAMASPAHHVRVSGSLQAGAEPTPTAW